MSLAVTEDSVQDLMVNAKGNGAAFVTGADQAAQGVTTRLKLFKGEWFLDLQAGTPWFQEILVDNPDVRRIESVLKARILGHQDVEEMLSFALEFDRATRDLTVQFEANTIYGPTGPLEVST